MKVIADVASIATAKNIMLDNYNELIGMVNNYKRMVEETDSIYDTDSAVMYRKLSDNYIEFVENYLNKDFKPYIEQLTEVEKMYTELHDYIATAIQGE